jgi:hypothetical protein
MAQPKDRKNVEKQNGCPRPCWDLIPMCARKRETSRPLRYTYAITTENIAAADVLEHVHAI